MKLLRYAVTVFIVSMACDCQSQIAGTWVTYKTVQRENTTYPQEKWDFDTLIFTNETFERRLAIRDSKYRIHPRLIKGTYKLKKKELTFISNDNLFEVAESHDMKINEYGELMLGKWITPVDNHGNRDYRQSGFRVWTYYRKLD